MFKIISCADKEFFHFMPTLERNVKNHFGEYPIIYDIGMTAKQSASLKSRVIKVTPPSNYNQHSKIGSIITSHKPNCVLDFMSQYSEDCLYVDADVLFTEKVTPDEFTGADISVTPRHPNELKSENPYKNGTLNAGVLFFKNTAPVKTFIESWISQCALDQVSDQMAISELLEDARLTNGAFGLVKCGPLSVLKLDARIYNDVGSTIGKIWHFKNAGRRFHKRRRYLKAALLDRFFQKSRTHAIQNRRRAEINK